MNYVWMAPVMLEYFYSQATPNDYFIGCLGGPGYVYPKAVPKRHLARMVELAYGLMKRLDSARVRDHGLFTGGHGRGQLGSDPGRGGRFLRRHARRHRLCQRLYPVPHVHGAGKRPLISYDYYLAPECSEDQVAADLDELAAINQKRPYFLLMHVRQYSNIKKVKTILDRLGPEFKVVPLDVFLKMAGEQPTFQERFLEKE